MARTTMPLALLVAAALAGCADDPAKNVPRATVETSRPAPAPAAPTAAPPPAAPEKLTITPETAKVEFIGSKTLGDAHHGGFKVVRGTAEVAPGKPDLVAIAVDIDATSIYTDNEKLTAHLRNHDFFDVDKYPTATFLTTEIKPGGEKGATHTLVGALTLHGVTKSIAIPATVKVEGDTLALTSEFALNKDDFDMTFSAGGVIRREVVIKLDVKAVKKG